MQIIAEGLEHRAINEIIRSGEGPFTIEGCLGQRFIAAGMSDCDITINGVSGNALGAYLNGATITVRGNAQDAVGDTMNEGRIIVHGSIGDAAGYAMRGGSILVEGDAGYRAGIHMKAYEDKAPLLVIGGCAGSFLGEYQAGGTIIVLDLAERASDRPRRIVGNFPCTGMHGGRMFLRARCEGIDFPPQVTARSATEQDLASIAPILEDYCAHFGLDAAALLAAPFTVVTPDSANPYRQMYVPN